MTEAWNLGPGKGRNEANQTIGNIRQSQSENTSTGGDGDGDAATGRQRRQKKVNAVTGRTGIANRQRRPLAGLGSTPPPATCLRIKQTNKRQSVIRKINIY